MLLFEEIELDNVLGKIEELKHKAVSVKVKSMLFECENLVESLRKHNVNILAIPEEDITTHVPYHLNSKFTMCIYKNKEIAE